MPGFSWQPAWFPDQCAQPADGDCTVLDRCSGRSSLPRTAPPRLRTRHCGTCGECRHNLRQVLSGIAPIMYAAVAVLIAASVWNSWPITPAVSCPQCTAQPKFLVGVGIMVAHDPLQSGRTVARSGLRMMPTFPPSPLSFRTAGFPGTAGRLACQTGPSQYIAGLSLLPAFAT